MKGRPPPAPGLLRQVDAMARGAMPVTATALVMILATVPAGVPGSVAAIALPAVFFWSIFRPSVMPPPAVFALGLMQDLLAAAPLGTGVLTLLVAHGLAFRWREFLARRSFLAVWLVFCGIAAGAAALGWVLQAVLSWQLPPLPPGLSQFGLTVGLYPLLAYPMTRAHQAMRRAEAVR